MLQQWENDHKKPNPYVLPRRTANGAASDPDRTSDTSQDLGPCGFLVLGLDIKQAQVSLAAQKAEATTTLQQVSLQKRAAPLLHKVHQFLQLQAKYMPSLTSQGVGPVPRVPTSDNIETYPIQLPSDLSPTLQGSVCAAGYAQVEDNLQHADAYKALDELRHALRIRAAYNCDKVKNVTGQVPNTHAREKQGSADESGSGKWEATLRPLLDKDVIGLNECALTHEELANNECARDMGGAAEDDSVPLSGVVSIGEGRKTLSWILYISDGDALCSNNNDPGLQDSLRVEWVKAKARTAQWTEQVCLVDKEMRHVIATTQHIVKEWNLCQSQHQSQVDSQDLLDTYLDEGLTAYADEHCATEMVRAAHLEEKWRVACADSPLIRPVPSHHPPGLLFAVSAGSQDLNGAEASSRRGRGSFALARNDLSRDITTAWADTRGGGVFRIAGPAGRRGVFRVYAVDGWCIAGAGPLRDGHSVETF
ncbi:hypothetical protein VTO73DRAFT_9222 [Trametes versicolor]